MVYTLVSKTSARNGLAGSNPVSPTNMNLNQSYDWGMDMVKKLNLKYPFKATNILYGYIPRGTILLDDIEQKVVF